MTDTVAIVTPEEALTVAVSEGTYVISTAPTTNQNSTVLETVDTIGDVDVVTNGKNNGSILVYRTNTNKWTSTTTLDAQHMEGGEF